MIMSAPLILYFNEVPEFAVFVIIMMWSSILPDFDVPICRRISRVRHRGISHTVWFVAVCSAMALVAYNLIEPWIFFNEETVLLGVSLGTLSHIIGDGLNGDGVSPFMLVEDDGYHLQLADIQSDSYLFNNLFMSVGIILVFLAIGIKSV